MKLLSTNSTNDDSYTPFCYRCVVHIELWPYIVWFSKVHKSKLFKTNNSEEPFHICKLTQSFNVGSAKLILID